MKLSLSIFVFIALLFGSSKSKVKMISPTPVGIYIISEKEKTQLSTDATIMQVPIVDKQYSNVLIIHYDKQVGTDKLQKAVKKQKAKIVYSYENFNAVAVSFPKEKSLDGMVKYFSKVKGVLTVQKNEIHQLD